MNRQSTGYAWDSADRLQNLCLSEWAEPILIAGGRAVGHCSEIFVGIDVSKARNAIAVAEGMRGGEVRFVGEIDSAEESMRRLVKRLTGKGERAHFCYEAGPLLGSVVLARPSSRPSVSEPARETNRGHLQIDSWGERNHWRSVRARVRRGADAVLKP